MFARSRRSRMNKLRFYVLWLGDKGDTGTGCEEGCGGGIDDE